MPPDPNNPNDPQKPVEGDPQPSPEVTPPAEGAPGGQPPDSKPAAEPASTEQVQQALKALSDIQQRMIQQGTTPSGQDAADKYREQIKDQTGWTDAQIDFNQQSIANTVAPIQAELSWMKVEKAHPDLPKYKELIEKELADGYTDIAKANSIIIEKAYYLAKGRAMENQPPSSRPADNPPKPRIAPGYPGFQQGMDGSGRPNETAINAEQHEYAKRLGVPDEAYLRASKTKNVQELKKA